MSKAEVTFALKLKTFNAMSETLLKQLQNDQQKMTRRAMRMVLIIASCIHILLNAFAYFNNDPLLKVEMPILTGVSVVVILIVTRMTKH